MGGTPQIKASCAARLKLLTTAVADIDKLNGSDRKHYHGEFRIATVRKNALEKLNGSAEELETFINLFSSKDTGTPTKSGGSQGDATMGLGNAPPCASYKDLVTWDSLELAANEILECQTLDEIAEKKKQISVHLAPMNDLYASAGAVLSDINKVKKIRLIADKAKPAVLTTRPGRSGNTSEVRASHLISKSGCICSSVSELISPWPVQLLNYRIAVVYGSALCSVHPEGGH